VERGGRERARGRAARVGDEDVDVAERVDRLVDEARRAVGRADVRDEADRAVADAGSGIVHAGAVAPADGDTYTFRGERGRGCEPEPGGRSGHRRGASADAAAPPVAPRG